MRTPLGEQCAQRMDSSRVIRHHQEVAEDWRRLANYVRARRIELGWRHARDLAEATGLTPQTISAVETGRSVRADTLSIIETALKWKPGSADGILAGGEPILEENPPHPTGERAPTPTELRHKLQEETTTLSDGVIDQIVLLYSGYWEARREIDRAG